MSDGDGDGDGDRASGHRAPIPAWCGRRTVGGPT
jgi:hypothetical protein